jgi:hypothetical protein
MLADLPAIVRGSKCFVFVLSAAVFESKWCLLELAAAVEAKVPTAAIRGLFSFCKIQQRACLVDLSILALATSFYVSPALLD